MALAAKAGSAASALPTRKRPARIRTRPAAADNNVAETVDLFIRPFANHAESSREVDLIGERAVSVSHLKRYCLTGCDLLARLICYKRSRRTLIVVVCLLRLAVDQYLRANIESLAEDQQPLAIDR